MDSIGSHDFIWIHGAIMAPAAVLTDRTEPGEAGAVYEKEAIRGKETELECLSNYSSGSDADTQLAAYQTLIGTDVTIERGASSIGDVTIIDVDEVDGSRRQCGNAKGGRGPGYTFLMKTKWKVRICAPTA